MGGPLQEARTLQDHLTAITGKLCKTQPRFSQSLHAMMEYPTSARAIEPGFGVCQHHQEFPRGLPSKHHPGLMGTGVSKMAGKDINR